MTLAAWLYVVLYFLGLYSAPYLVVRYVTARAPELGEKWDRFWENMAAADIEQQRHEREDDFLYPGEIIMLGGLVLFAAGALVWLCADNWTVLSRMVPELVSAVVNG